MQSTRLRFRQRLCGIVVLLVAVVTTITSIIIRFFVVLVVRVRVTTITSSVINFFTECSLLSFGWLTIISHDQCRLVAMLVVFYV